MNTGVVDTFLNVFTTYIDSGFGLLGGEVAFLSSTLVVIDVTLAGLFWAWGADSDILARLVKKVLYVGVFAFIISNFNHLSQVVFQSFEGLGLKAAGSSLSSDDFLHPGKIAQAGIDAGVPILQAASQLTNFASFFENFIQIIVLLIGWVIVIVAFFILAVQLFVTLIEFKLTTLAGFHPGPVRPVRQDRLPGREGARQRRGVRREGPGAGGDRRHRIDPVQPVRHYLRRRPADPGGRAGIGAGFALPHGARHLRSRHRHRVGQWRAPAWRGRCGRHGHDRRRPRDGGRHGGVRWRRRARGSRPRRSLGGGRRHGRHARRTAIRRLTLRRTEPRTCAGRSERAVRRRFRRRIAAEPAAGQVQ